MGLGGISIWQILIILGIVILLFGTSKLRNVGSDLGSALKGFKKSMKEDESDSSKKDADFEPLDKPVEKTSHSASEQDITEKQKQTNKE